MRRLGEGPNGVPAPVAPASAPSPPPLPGGVAPAPVSPEAKARAASDALKRGSCGPGTTVFRKPAPANAPKPQAVAFDVEALTTLLTRIPPITMVNGPYQAPPWRASDLPLRFRAVVNVPAAADAAANLGGIALASAEALELGVAIPVLTPTAVGLPVVVGTFNVPPKTNGRLARLRVSAQGYDALRAARVSINLSGLPVVPDTDWSPASDQPADAPIYVELKARQVLTVVARNLDPHSAILLEVALDGWTWSVVASDDALDASLVRQDPALDEAWGSELAEDEEAE